MPEPELDIWLGAAMLLLAALSFAAWAVIAARKSRGATILRYEPRQPVPWGPEGAVLALVLVSVVILSVLGRGSSGEAADDAPAANMSIDQLVSSTLMQSSFVFAFLLAVVLISGAKWRDLCLPKRVCDAARDAKIGFIAWLLALGPVYGVQAVLVNYLGKPSEHPLIQIVEKHPSPGLFVAAFGVAVIAAPICEEITFRLLLQGWLEKWEDARMGWRTPATPEVAATSPLPLGEACGELSRAGQGEGALVDGSAVESSTTDQLASSPPPPIEPPLHGVFGLPYGWFPILVSSSLFAAAHFGVGPDPIPIFLLALVLGFVFQRTNHILPGIVTHALFNSLTILALWQLSHGAAQ